MAVVKTDIGVVGHIPREPVESSWLGMGLKYLAGLLEVDSLLEGGLEIPCIYAKLRKICRPLRHAEISERRPKIIQECNRRNRKIFLGRSDEWR